MSNVLVTLEYHRAGETLCWPSKEGRKNSHLMWQARFALTGLPIGKPEHNGPFFAAARALLAQGYDPQTMLYLVDVGAPDTSRWRLRGRIGAMADKTTAEPDSGARPIHVAKWKPRPEFGTAPAEGEPS